MYSTVSSGRPLQTCGWPSLAALVVFLNIPLNTPPFSWNINEWVSLHAGKSLPLIYILSQWRDTIQRIWDVSWASPWCCCQSDCHCSLKVHCWLINCPVKSTHRDVSRCRIKQCKSRITAGHILSFISKLCILRNRSYCNFIAVHVNNRNMGKHLKYKY